MGCSTCSLSPVLVVLVRILQGRSSLFQKGRLSSSQPASRVRCRPPPFRELSLSRAPDAETSAARFLPRAPAALRMKEGVRPSGVFQTFFSSRTRSPNQRLHGSPYKKRTNAGQLWAPRGLENRHDGTFSLRRRGFCRSQCPPPPTGSRVASPGDPPSCPRGAGASTPQALSSLKLFLRCRGSPLPD